MSTLTQDLEIPAVPAPCRSRMDFEHPRRWIPNDPIPESPVDCLITVDQHGEIIDFNPAAERMFACDRLRVVGQLLVDLIIPPAIRDRQWRVVFRHLLEGAGSFPGPGFEVIASRGDGSEFPAEVSIQRLHADEPYFYAVQLWDITARKRAASETDIFVRH